MCKSSNQSTLYLWGTISTLFVSLSLLHIFSSLYLPTFLVVRKKIKILEREYFRAKALSGMDPRVPDWLFVGSFSSSAACPGPATTRSACCHRLQRSVWPSGSRYQWSVRPAGSSHGQVVVESPQTWSSSTGACCSCWSAYLSQVCLRPGRQASEGFRSWRWATSSGLGFEIRWEGVVEQGEVVHLGHLLHFQDCLGLHLKWWQEFPFNQFIQWILSVPGIAGYEWVPARIGQFFIKTKYFVHNTNGQ